MEWSNEITIKFLDIYEKEPVIWDPSHKLHKNRNEVYDAWKRIKTEFSPEVSIDELKKKKDSLMATFRNCKSKLKRSEKSGAGSSDTYTPHWFAFAKMAGFLMHHDRPRNTINSEFIELEENEIASQNILDSQLENLETAEHNARVTVRSEKKSSNVPAAKKKKSEIRDDIIYDRMENAYNMLKQQSMPKATIVERSECTIYGELIAKRLEKMEPSERDYAMHEIDNVMYQVKLRFGGNRGNTFPPTQSNINFSQSSHFTTPSPSFVHASPVSNMRYSNPPSVETYLEEHTTKEFHENFT